MGLSNAERQARWRAKRDAEIERLRNAAPVPEELAEARKGIAALRKQLAEARGGRAGTMTLDVLRRPDASRPKCSCASKRAGMNGISGSGFKLRSRRGAKGCCRNTTSDLRKPLRATKLIRSASVVPSTKLKGAENDFH